MSNYKKNFFPRQKTPLLAISVRGGGQILPFPLPWQIGLKQICFHSFVTSSLSNFPQLSSIWCDLQDPPFLTVKKNIPQITTEGAVILCSQGSPEYAKL